MSLTHLASWVAWSHFKFYTSLFFRSKRYIIRFSPFFVWSINILEKEVKKHRTLTKCLQLHTECISVKTNFTWLLLIKCLRTPSPGNLRILAKANKKFRIVLVECRRICCKLSTLLRKNMLLITRNRAYENKIITENEMKVFSQASFPPGQR